MDNIYYCYSTRLYHFLSAVKIRYIDKAINHNTNKSYWTYQKGEKLDAAIKEYNRIKHLFA